MAKRNTEDAGNNGGTNGGENGDPRERGEETAREQFSGGNKDASAAPDTPKLPTHKQRMAAHVPTDGNINVFAEGSAYEAKNNFVHGFIGTRYVNLRDIDPELAELLATDANVKELEKKTEASPS